jgi:hypothetical protein
MGLFTEWINGFDVPVENVNTLHLCLSVQFSAALTNLGSGTDRKDSKDPAPRNDARIHQRQEGEV